MTTADLVAEEARRFAVQTGLEVEEAETVLRTYGIHVEAIEQEEDWDG